MAGGGDGDKDLTGWPRALSAGPRTAPRVPAALAAAPLPPPAAAAAPAHASRPAPPPLRREGDKRGSPRAPQTPAQLTPKGRMGGWDPRMGSLRGVAGELRPTPLLPGDGRRDAASRRRSPCRAALPWASSARSRRRASTSSRSAVALASSLAWGEGTRRRGDNGGQCPPVTSSTAGALHLLTTSPCPPHVLPLSSLCPPHVPKLRCWWP